MTELTEGWLIALYWRCQLIDPESVGELAEEIDQRINEQPKWRPMDTAPKDGSKVDLWVMHSPSGGEYRLPDCWWSRAASAWYRSGPFPGCVAEHAILFWLPPPPPPKAAR